METPQRRGRSLEDFDAPERTLTADRTRAQPTRQEFEQDVACPGAVGLPLGESIGLVESPTAGCEQAGASAVGQEPVVTDANEAFGEDVEQEAPSKLGKRE